MKVSELLNNQLLLESVTLDTNISSLSQLKDPKTGNFYTGVVNVTGNIWLEEKRLKSFPVKFGKVGDVFSCPDNSLTTLEGAPREVGMYFDCRNNFLTSLEGAPRKVNGNFACSGNQITSLEGIHKIIQKMDGYFSLSDNPIKIGGIGLLLIEGLKQVKSNNLPAFKIINKYFGHGKKGLLLCQEELIENDFEEYAKL